MQWHSIHILVAYNSIFWNQLDTNKLIIDQICLRASLLNRDPNNLDTYVKKPTIRGEGHFR